MIRRLLILALVAAACSKGSTPPAIISFVATPDTLHQGESATLAWVVDGASQISIDQGVGVQDGHSVNVTPAATTSYTLTATGLGGVVTATATVTVLGPLPKPAITSLTASPTDVPVGGASTLTWTTSGTVTSLSLSDGVNPPVDVTGTATRQMSPVISTTYTLTATNSGGSDSRQVSVSVHAPGLRLQYTDPASTTAKILVVKSASSTSTNLVLDVKVGAAPIAAFGFAMSIPLLRAIPADPAANGPFAADPSQSPAGLKQGIINMGASPITGALMVGGAAMPRFISVGVAKHKATLADGDDTWAAGSTLFSIALKMVGTPGTGDIFIGSAVAADPAFRAAALHEDGTEAVGKADIALGDFTIAL